MDLDLLLQTYIAEGRELLDEMESLLLRLEGEEDQQESLNAIFRAAHTIKGSAGLFGLDDIVAFTHGVESLLDLLRDGSIAINADIFTLLFNCRDHISDLLDLVDSDITALSDKMKERGETLTKALTNQVAGVKENVKPEQSDSSLGTAEVIISEHVKETLAESDHWHISIRFGLDSLRDGMDPISFLSYLETLGEIVEIHTLDDALPFAEAMNPESCYLGFEINFKSELDKKTIEDVFQFIREDSVLKILSPHSPLLNYIAHISELPEQDEYLAKILTDCGSLTSSELEQLIHSQEQISAQNNHQQIDKIDAEDNLIIPVSIENITDKEPQSRDNKVPNKSQSIRVDAGKLDELINLIGELVIASAGSSIIAQSINDTKLNELILSVSNLVEEVRDSALRLRMVQIGGTFNRFQRVVRDVSSELGKDINLLISGAETELDKTVVEKIGDPLMHLVRNSIDHGIESSERRLSNGKSAKGTLKLNAYHDSGSIVIEVSDDGAGLNRERILNKAIEKGLITEHQELEDQEVYNLIFEPGFSTADAVTNLSGRGVGMDVVKRNIEALRGTVDLDSTPGKGSIFRIRMPLTLAIIDGFEVSVSESSFVIPLDMILECIELDHTLKKDVNYINLRGEVLPLIHLRAFFSIEGRGNVRENVVVVHCFGNKVGLVIDHLMGEIQTVIKPLGEIFKNISGVSGFTILGNGEVALILDIPRLVQKAILN